MPPSIARGHSRSVLQTAVAARARVLRHIHCSQAQGAVPSAPAPSGPPGPQAAAGPSRI